MQSKYAEPTFLCTYCEVCKKKFETRSQFEYGCERCSPMVVARVKPSHTREWFDTE